MRFSTGSSCQPWVNAHGIFQKRQRSRESELELKDDILVDWRVLQHAEVFIVVNRGAHLAGYARHISQTERTILSYAMLLREVPGAQSKPVNIVFAGGSIPVNPETGLLCR